MTWVGLCYIQESLHTDVKHILQRYPPIQRGGPLYFSILIGQLVLSNKQRWEALVSLVQAYNIAIDGKDDLIPVSKLLHCATKSIIAMRLDNSSRRQQIPDLYVKYMLKVLQTSSMVDFTNIIKQYDDWLEFQLFQTRDHANSPIVLELISSFH